MTSDVSQLQNVTAADVANLNNNTAATSASLSSDFDNFLILLTTQLQNQDPMNPTDSTEFTNQLVQFSQVEQSINTNQKLDTLVQMQFSNALSQAVGFVGLNATYPSAEIPFDGETPVDLAYFLPKNASTTNIYIYDSQGELITKESITGLSGTNNFTWDGTDDEGFVRDEGTYSFSIEALDGQGNTIEGIDSIVTGRVDGVESQGGQIFLLVGERAVPLNNVINALEPEIVATEEGGAETTEEEGGTS